MMLVSGSSCAQAQSNKEQAAASTSAKPSPAIAEFCKKLDQAMAVLEKDPENIQKIGDILEKSTETLDKSQKLTAADKSALKKSMNKAIEVIVKTQLKQAPEIANALASMTEEQKKETIDLALKTATKEIDSRIDACKTIEDFIGVANQ